MPSLNRIMIMGHLGGDPDVRYLPSGAQITTFSVATTEKWTDRDTNEKRERTTWHKVDCFGGTAEFASKHLYKGQLVYVEGKQYHERIERDGVVRYFASIKCDELKPLQWRDDNSPRPTKQQPEGRPQPALDDDIPF